MQDGLVSGTQVGQHAPATVSKWYPGPHAMPGQAHGLHTGQQVPDGVMSIDPAGHFGIAQFTLLQETPPAPAPGAPAPGAPARPTLEPPRPAAEAPPLLLRPATLVLSSSSETVASRKRPPQAAIDHAPRANKHSTGIRFEERRVIGALAKSGVQRHSITDLSHLAPLRDRIRPERL